jgi:hypothetical protein
MEHRAFGIAELRLDHDAARFALPGQPKAAVRTRSRSCRGRPHYSRYTSSHAGKASF